MFTKTLTCSRHIFSKLNYNIYRRNIFTKSVFKNWEHKISFVNQTFSTKTTQSKTKMVDQTEEVVSYLDIPDKSENDKKLYKTLQLSNGLRALLVSDPSPVPHDGLTTSSSSCESSGAEESSSGEESMDTTSTEDDSQSDSEEGDEKLAACAVLVDIGSMSEPKEYQGLAHFLEHMIFMGSEKFPTENAFDAHIKKCGGFDNANTDFEETVFYFEVSEEHLDSSMDYFTALLKAPLMKKEAMTRERDSVESEFQQTLHDDESRRDQLLASYANNDYPHSTFSWGNLKSLKENVNDDELHKQLHEFRKLYYSANRMFVCVQARLPIEELEALVVKHFADVPSNSVSTPDFANCNYREAFQPDFYKKLFLVKPVENTHKLEFTWVLPPMTKLYKCKPEQFLSHLIGYEGEGSLCAYLRKRLWCLELIAGVDDSGFDNNSIYSLFNLCIQLTDKGLEQIDEVVAATFAFIKLFANTTSLKDTYRELQRIEATSFRFESQKAAFDNVQDLVLRSKYYPPKDIMTATQLYFEYNEQQIHNVIDHLNEFNFNIMLTSSRTYENHNYDQKEKWFGTEYTTIDMPTKWIDLWNNSKPLKELHLPLPNRFVSTDFRLFWQENGQPELSQSPKKLLQTNVCELWFRQDDKFNLPDAHMYFYFISPLLRQNAKNDVLCALYAHLLKYRLAEELYPAIVAGLHYQFYAGEKGVILKVIGYNEKINLLVDIITKAMISMDANISDEELDVFKIYQKKTYFNSLIKPRALNKDIRLSIVESIHWPTITKYKCLNDISIKDMLEFSRKFPNELYVQTLMQGNLTEESAHNVMNSVLTTLNCQKIKETKYIENRTVQMPQGSHYIRCNALNGDDTNTVICNYYQIGPCTLRGESIMDLLMMFVDEPLFDTLRTKEQLGYSVGAKVITDYGIAGYMILINSQETKHSANYVEERIEAFRSKMLVILEDMPQDEFDHVRDSLIKIKQVVDMSLDEEVSRNWNEITCEEYIFDRRRKEIDILRMLTKEDIIEFCLNNERTNLRKLSVQVVGNVPIDDNKSEDDLKDDDDKSESLESDGDEEELFNSLASCLDLHFIPRDGDATTITDIDEFKENLHVYPITKTKMDDPNIDEIQIHRGSLTAEFIEDIADDR